MPSNRVRRTRGPIKPLSDGERHLLLTGKPYPARGKGWPDGSSWVRPYMLAAPAGMEELRSLWSAHRAALLAGWTGKVLPWAARAFGG